MEQIFSSVCSVVGSFCGEKLVSICLILIVLILCVLSNKYGKNDLKYTDKFQELIKTLSVRAIVKHRDTQTQNSPHTRVRDIVESITILEILELITESDNEKLKKITNIENPGKLKDSWKAELDALFLLITSAEQNFRITQS